MSDDDMDMMYDEDEEEMQEDEEENEDEDEDPKVKIENEYYNAKGMLEEDEKAAIEGFENVIKMETEKGEWGFKSLKKLIKLYFNKGDNKKVVDRITKFMEYTKSAVSSNYAEKGINSVLDTISASKDVAFVEEAYSICLSALKKFNNERVWFRTNLRLAKLFFENNEHSKLVKILRELRTSCQNEKGEDDIKKGGQLVEIYALEIQLYTETKNTKKLKDLYLKGLELVRIAIPSPRIIGIIHECGGKMYMREKEWEKANTDFFEAFKNYDGPKRIQCLKYLVLASMLSLSNINPFDSTEAKPYRNHPEIVAMTNLVSAYEQNNIKSFEKILQTNKQTILEDSFMKDYINDLLKNIRTQVLIKILAPYTKIRLPFLAAELNIDSKEVEDLLVSLILDTKVQGRIDQVNQWLELEGSKATTFWKYRAVEKWAGQLSNLQNSIIGRLN